MDYKLLEKIVDDFLREEKNEMFVDNLHKIIPLCESVINMQELPVNNENYSRNFDLNESLRIISSFLSTISSSLQSQFENVITQVNNNNEPVVSFFNTNKSYYDSYPEELTEAIKLEMERDSRVEVDGKVYIHLDKSIEDMFTILHEVFHYMNSYNIIQVRKDGAEYNLGENYTRNFYGEAVSITAEKLFADYLLQNKLITQNDYNLLMNKRLIDSKNSAKTVIFESELIKMRQLGYEFNENSFRTYSSFLLGNKVREKIVDDEYKYGRYTSAILNKGELQFTKSQRYVIGQVVSNTFSYNGRDIKRFEVLHKEVGNPYADLNAVTESLENTRGRVRQLKNNGFINIGIAVLIFIVLLLIVCIFNYV